MLFMHLLSFVFNKPLQICQNLFEEFGLTLYSFHDFQRLLKNT